MPTDLRDQLQSTLGTAYSLERELGGGGMSRVFVAAEAALGRRVVVKVLPPDLAAGVDAARFRRETQLAASLTHPHIVPLLAAGDADGVPYYTMPFLEGESLRARLAREGRLPVEEAVRLAREVADALDYAHRRGIVHRDVKPENVLLHDGHAVVADFGIARAVTRAASDPTLTQAGLALGTPAYMSPEQALGEREVDGRADVYSLGCVLYEMLTGRSPYEAATAPALLVKHCTAPVPSAGAARPDVPRAVDAALGRALAKEPADRFETAAEMARALAVASAEAPRPADRAAEAHPFVAVLPFQNLSPDPDTEYFADGITEDLITHLAKLGGLRVISRTTAIGYKGTTKPPAEVARALGVTHRVEGSVRQAGGRLRIVARLVAAATDEHLWAETYDRDLADVFAIQTDVTTCIAGALRARLTPEERSRLARRPTDDLEAYNLLLRGRYHYNRGTPEDFRQAVDCYERALARDPGFAAACAALAQARTYLGLGYFGTRPHDVMPEVLRLTSRAVELDPALADGYAERANAREWYSFEWDGALQDRHRARELDPSNGMAHITYAIHLVARHRFDEAATERDRACELDPGAVVARGNAVWVTMLMRRYDAALAEARSLEALAPEFFGTWNLRGWVASCMGLKEEAIGGFRRGLRLGGPPIFTKLMLAYALARFGEPAEARTILAEMHARERAGEFIWPLGFALAYTYLGETERALDHLERAYQERVGWMLLIGVDPLLDPLRGEPRFQELVRRVGPPEAASALPSHGPAVRAAPAAPAAPARVTPAPRTAPTGALDPASRLPAGEAGPKRLVVLPFENLSADPDTDYFADGLTEEVIADLSQVRALTVLSRASAMRLKGTARTLPELGAELGVRYALTGSVRKAGDSLRITAALVDTAADAQVWAEKYGGTVGDVLDIQERVSRAIVDALRLRLSPEEDRRIAHRPIEDPRAYDCYLRAHHKLLRFSASDLDDALALLGEGLKILGENELLLGTMGQVYVYYVHWGVRPDPRYLAEAERCVRAVFRLNPGSVQGHAVLGALRMKRGELQEAVRDLRRAVTADPGHLDALTWLAYCYLTAGKPAAARPVIEHLLEVDPLTAINHAAYGWLLATGGRLPEALPHYDRGYELDASSPLMRLLHGWALAQNGRRAEAARELAHFADEAPGTAFGALAGALSHALTGDGTAARAAVSPLLVTAAGHDEALSQFLSEVFALAGDHDEALRWLECAVRRGYLNYPMLADVDRLYGRLREDARFARLMVEVRRRWEQFAV